MSTLGLKRGCAPTEQCREISRREKATKFLDREPRFGGSQPNFNPKKKNALPKYKERNKQVFFHMQNLKWQRWLSGGFPTVSIMVHAAVNAESKRRNASLPLSGKKKFLRKFYLVKIWGISYICQIIYFSGLKRFGCFRDTNKWKSFWPLSDKNTESQKYNLEDFFFFWTRNWLLTRCSESQIRPQKFQNLDAPI